MFLSAEATHLTLPVVFGDALRCVAFSWSKHGASQSALASYHTGASVLAQMSTEVVCELMLLIGTKAGLTSLSKYQNPDFTIGWIVSKVLLKFVKIGIFSMYLSRHQVESWTVSVANADAAVLTQMYCRSRLRTNTVHSNWNRLEVLVKTGRLCIFRKS